MRRKGREDEVSHARRLPVIARSAREVPSTLFYLFKKIAKLFGVIARAIFFSFSLRATECVLRVRETLVVSPERKVFLPEPDPLIGSPALTTLPSLSLSLPYVGGWGEVKGVVLMRKRNERERERESTLCHTPCFNRKKFRDEKISCRRSAVQLKSYSIVPSKVRRHRLTAVCG